jgi:metallo-beta-lactamase family protein
VADITFIGAAGTVTGSKHLVSSGGKHLLVDCGLFQGVVNVRTLNDVPLPVAPAQISAVVITHGHLDHTGYLPKLVRDGFSGPIYCTPPTKPLMDIVLEDAANLQDMMTKRGFEHERPQSTPAYYDAQDVARTLQLVQTKALGETFDVAGIASATYHNAGHIIGSAFADLLVEGKHAIFSGDVGRYGRPLMYDPDPLPYADALVCESTYADRVHPPDALGDLNDALEAGLARGGPVVIPAFSVERTQDLLLAIATLQKSNPKIAALAMHLDSPMAVKVDALFERFPGAHKLVAGDSPGTPLGVRNLTVHVTTDESKELNTLPGPFVVISASGMASGGRVLHHLHRALPDPTATVVFTGYQGAGTLGYNLVHGAHSARIFGDTLPVRAKIVPLAGFSAHADRNDLQRWLATCPSKPHLYAVHGEAESASALAALAAGVFGWPADVAKRGTTVTV